MKLLIGFCYVMYATYLMQLVRDQSPAYIMWFCFMIGGTIMGIIMAYQHRKATERDWRNTIKSIFYSLAFGTAMLVTKIDYGLKDTIFVVSTLFVSTFSPVIVQWLYDNKDKIMEKLSNELSLDRFFNFFKGWGDSQKNKDDE